MLKNYLKTAFRNLWKHKIDSAISIGGLSVGIACCILIIVFVRFELSYDTFHENSDRVFRVVKEFTQPRSGEVVKSVSTPYPMAQQLKTTFPEIDKVVRLGKTFLPIKIDKKFSTEEILLTDPGLFEVFSFPLLKGDPGTVLSAPDNIVLTDRIAERFFGSTDVIGEIITIRFAEEERNYQVSGIAAVPPDNSSIKFDIVLPVENYLYTLPARQRSVAAETWSMGFVQTWLLLNPQASPNQLEEKFHEFQTSHIPERFISKMWLQPLDDVYFNEDISPHFTEQGNKMYAWILAGIAIVVLTIASFNFISLTLSRSSARNHEIGIRKAVGAQKSQIVQQFLGEVFVTCGIAFILGIALAELSLPFLQTIVQKPVHFGLTAAPDLWLLLFGLLLLTTFLTGTYPAFIMSRRKATALFRSRQTSERIPLFVRSLIALQFALSISFVITAFIMQQQMDYLINKDIGISPTNVIAIDVMGLGMERANDIAELYIQEARRLSDVEVVSGSSIYFHEKGWGASIMSGTGLEDFDDNFINIEAADEHFIETLGIRLIAGSNFSVDRPTDLKEGIIVNQQFVDVLGLDDPVGRIISEEYEYGFFHPQKRIIGLIEDYHYRTLHHHLEPMVMVHRDAIDWAIISTILIKSRGGAINRTLERLTALWNELLPDETFVYYFLDERIHRQYAEEQRWSRIIQASSGVTILLPCFGLFGLASLSAQRRTKEIGIRKVLGATVADIMVLLNGGFLKLVVIGFITAIPVALYAMNHWLENFAYRVDITWWVFIIAGSLALVIALVTVSFHAVRAATSNPVDALRYE